MPMVILRCNIQWMEGWGNSGMLAVATSRLQPIMAGAGKDAPDTSKLVQQVLALHTSRLAAGATPRHYLAFVGLCGSLCAKNRSHLLEQQDFLKVTPGPPITTPPPPSYTTAPPSVLSPYS